MSAAAPSPGDRQMPHRVLAGWLGAETAANLLSYAVAQEARFKPTKVIRQEETGRIDPSTRRSHMVRDLGAFASLLRHKAEALRPTLEAAFGMGPAPAGETEIEMVAHGDDHFYRPHIDTFTGDDTTGGTNRRLSLVYYLHREPRASSGGRLRLLGLGGVPSPVIEPAHDTLLAFPSFLPHEVEPVCVTPDRFESRRFAVDIWLHG